MNPAQLHLMLNHVPVIGTFFAIALLAYGLLARSDDVIRACLGLFALLAVAAGLVFVTGEGAEELVEGLPGVTEAVIERHEDIARIATISLGGLGILALGGLLVFRRATSIPRVFAWSVLLLAIVPAAVMAYTAHTGGQIRHGEIPGAVETHPIPVPVADAGRVGYVFTRVPVDD